MPIHPPQVEPFLPSQKILVTLAVALACEVGLWFLEFNGRDVALIWPAAGIGAACAYRWGGAAVPWIMLGHVVIWLHLGLGPLTGWVPPLYAMEAWLAALLGTRFSPQRLSGTPSAMEGIVWRMLIAPLLATLPCATVMGWIGSEAGRFARGGEWMTIAKIATAHLHGMAAVTPLALHLIDRSAVHGRTSRQSLGFGAAALSLAITTLAFLGFFESTLGMSSAVYLAFPLVVLSGALLTPEAVSLFIAIWCLLTTTLTGAGEGPFDTGKRAANPLELGIYNIVFASMAYTVSVGSSRFLRQYHRSEQSLEAAGVELWEWTLQDGPKAVRHSADLDTLTAGLAPRDALARLAGTTGDTLSGLGDEWKLRHDPVEPAGKVLACTGRVLKRNRDGTPVEAVGILQDLSALRIADEALIALGYQQARLKSLQSRLNPHFLFNALNATRALIHLNPPQASEAVTILSRLLRANLKNSDRPLIPLAEEMAAVNDLLRMAAVRFENRLSTRLSIDPGLEQHPVPPMLIFNLVENALIHGIEKCRDGGELELTARLKEGRQLHVTVTNPGQLTRPLAQGVGTSDIKQRLELIFGAAARFSLSQSDPHRVTAMVLIPRHA